MRLRDVYTSFLSMAFVFYATVFAGVYAIKASDCFNSHCVAPARVLVKRHVAAVQVHPNYVSPHAYAYVPLSAAAQGTTVYGYGQNQATFNSYAETYKLNVDQLVNAAERLSVRSHEANREATAGLLKFSESIAGIARLQAAGDAVAKAAAAATPATVTQSFKIERSSEVKAETKPAPEALGASQVLASRCVKCHSGNDPKGGFDLSNIGILDANDWSKIRARVTSADPEKRMPPKSSLSVEEMQSLFIPAEQ